MRRLVPIVAVVLCLAAGGCGKDGGGTSSGGGELLVGVIFPMTGDHATFGEECWNGLALADEDIRKAGAPVPYKLLQKDEKSLKTEAANQAKSLIDNDGVHVLIGSVASSITMQIGQEAKEAGVPLITPASTNDDVTIQGGEWVSRICFKDSFQADVLARFALGKGWKKCAMVVDKANAYSTGLAKNFDASFTKGGGSVTTDYYSETDEEFSNVIENVAGRKPEVIFISGYYGDAGPMIRQAKGRWESVPVIGGDGMDSPKLIELIGDTHQEIYFSTHFAADGPDPDVQAFAKRYQDKYGKAPGAMAALGYDVLKVLMDAAKRAKDPRDRKELAKAIRETKGVKGITGTIDLTTPDRTPMKDLVFVKVEGAFHYHTTVGAAK